MFNDIQLTCRILPLDIHSEKQLQVVGIEFKVCLTTRVGLVGCDVGFLFLVGFPSLSLQAVSYFMVQSMVILLLKVGIYWKMYRLIAHVDHNSCDSLFTVHIHTITHTAADHLTTCSPRLLIITHRQPLVDPQAR